MTKKPIQPRTKALAPAQTSTPTAQPAPTETPISSAPKPKTKAALLREMLDAPAGATVPSIMAATGWQPHTVRAALSGLRTSGCVLDRRTGAEGTVYAIVHAEQCGSPASTGSDGPGVLHNPMPGITLDSGEDVSPPDDAPGCVEIARSAPVDAAATSTSTTETETHS